MEMSSPRRVTFIGQENLRKRGVLKRLMSVTIPTCEGDVHVWIEEVWTKDPTRTQPLPSTQFIGYEIMLGEKPPVVTTDPSDHDHCVYGEIEVNGNGFIEAGWTVKHTPKVIVSKWAIKAVSTP